MAEEVERDIYEIEYIFVEEGEEGLARLTSEERIRLLRRFDLQRRGELEYFRVRLCNFCNKPGDCDFGCEYLTRSVTTGNLCQHRFHEQCLSDWFATDPEDPKSDCCPVCQAPFLDNYYHDVRGEIPPDYAAYFRGEPWAPARPLPEEPSVRQPAAADIEGLVEVEENLVEVSDEELHSASDEELPSASDSEN